MGIKKKIKKQWYLESKDNLDNIKEQLNFDEEKSNFVELHNRKLVLKVISFTCIVFLVVVGGIATYQGLIKGGGLNFDSVPNSPNEDVNDGYLDAPDQSNPGEFEDPEGPSHDEYTYPLFIEGLKQNFIISDYIFYMNYEDLEYTNNEVIKMVCEYINGLEKNEISNDINIYSKKISLNDWVAIYLSDCSYIAFQYNNIIIHFDTNIQNAIEEIDKLIK